MFTRNIKRVAIGVVFGALGALPASATTIDFENLTGPSTYSAACSAVSCPQTVVESTVDGNVTFTGGVLLTAATNLPGDETSTYGTADFVSNLSNPITISFQNSISNFLVDVLNGETTSRTFTVADNLGHSSSFNLPSNASSGLITIGFATSGSTITVADTTGDGAYDIFIDNIQFNVGITCTDASCHATTGVPEPLSLSVFGAGLAGAAALRRRKKAKQA